MKSWAAVFTIYLRVKMVQLLITEFSLIRPNFQCFTCKEQIFEDENWELTNHKSTWNTDLKNGKKICNCYLDVGRISMPIRSIPLGQFFPAHFREFVLKIVQDPALLNGCGKGIHGQPLPCTHLLQRARKPCFQIKRICLTKSRMARFLVLKGRTIRKVIGEIRNKIKFMHGKVVEKENREKRKWRKK